MARVWPVSVALAVAYLLAGYLGLMLPAHGTNITLVWVPSGLAVGCLMRWGYGCWPGIAIGAVCVNWAIDQSLVLSAGIAVGNTLAPLSCAALLRSTDFEMCMRKPKDILWLSTAAALSMLVSATLGVVCLRVAGQLDSQVFKAWATWWAGDATGVIAAAPLVFVSTPQELRKLLRRRIELAVWTTLIVISVLAVFILYAAAAPGFALAFVPLPLMVWGAMRFGPVGTSLGIIYLSFGAALGVAVGQAQIIQFDVIESVVALWLFMLTCVIIGWLVSALNYSQNQAVTTARLLERALEDVSLGVLLAGPDRRITYANRGFASLTGYSEAELLGRSCSILQGPGTDTNTNRRLRDALETYQSFEGEILNYRKDGSAFWNALTISPLKDEDGRFTGFIGIQRDVSARRHAEVEASAANEQLEHQSARASVFYQLIDRAPQGICIMQLDGTLTFVNPALRKLLDLDFESSRSFRDLFSEDMQTFVTDTMLKEARERGFWMGESELLRSSGGRIATLIHTFQLLDLSGELTGYACIATDITELREAEKERNRLWNLSVDPMCIVGKDGYFKQLNPAWTSVLGWSIEELLARPCAEFIHPDDLQATLGSQAAVFNGHICRQFENRYLHQDGSWHWFSWTGNLLEDGQAVIAVARDVSLQKKAEQAMLASERKLKAIFLSEPECVKLLDRQGRLIDMNPAGLKLIDASGIDQVRGECVYPHIAERDRQAFIDMVAAVFEGETRSLRFGMTTLLGTECIVESNCVPLWDENHSCVKEMLSVTRDVTQRQRTEDALRESEEQLRTLVENAPEAIVVYDLDEGKLVTVNRNAEAMFGLGREELRQFSPIDLSPPLQPDGTRSDLAAQPYIESALKGQSPVFEWVHRSAQGKDVLCEIRLVRLPSSTRRLIRGSMTDISERKRSEKALQENEERLRVYIDKAPTGLFVVNDQGMYMDANPAGCLITGYSREELMTMGIRDLAHPDAVPAAMQSLNEVMRTGSAEIESPIRRKDGDTRWLSIAAVRLSDGRVLGFATDITERVLARQALQEVEQRQRLALDAARMGTWDWDIVNQQVRWDERQMELFGVRTNAEHQLPRRPLASLHPEDAPRIERELESAVQLGHDFEAEFRVVHPQNRTRWLYSRGRLLWDQQQRPARMVGIHYDITERIEAAQQLQASLGEKEAMLKEIHHRVKNNLQVISSLLNLQAERIADPAMRNMFLESQSRVRAMALVHETLYGADSLANVEMRTYISRLCDSLLHSFHDCERVQVNRSIDDIALNLDIAQPVGLIISELVSNALKHAFPRGRSGRIEVALNRSGEDDYQLSVSDDGVGLPVPAETHGNSSLGLHLVRVLSQQLRGRLESSDSAEHGTCFSIRFPQ